jgi:hypothetical protein
MVRSRPFTTQLVIVGGLVAFLYIFFALATAIYKDYKLDANIQKFQEDIDKLAEKANQKPKDVTFYQSIQYKDRYAKENLNLLNPGERLIIIPKEERVVKSEPVVVDVGHQAAILKLPYRQQWWQYFFGQTLSLKKPLEEAPVETGEQKQG